MKLRNGIKLTLTALGGAFLVSATVEALPLLAQVQQFIGDANAKKSASFANPIPAGIYPAWGADVSVTCSLSSTVSSQLAVGRYVVTCGAVAFGDQGTSTVATALGTERRIPSDYVYPVRVDDTTANGYIALACTASTVCLISADG